MWRLLGRVACAACAALVPVGAASAAGVETFSGVLPAHCALGVGLLEPGPECDPAAHDEAEPPEVARPEGGPIGGLAAPYSAHSMIYSCCTPYAQKRAAFEAARASGAGYIRLDVNLRGIFTVRRGKVRRPDWRGVDEISRLALLYRLPVVAVLTHVPAHITSCAADYRTSCAANDAEAYGGFAGQIAERMAGVSSHIEIVNKPDGPWAFSGSPQEYARMLDAAYRHIKARVPRTRVLLGGLMRANRRWISQMLATPSTTAIRRFDIANVHIRGRLGRLRGAVSGWRRFFADRGFRGRLWVTEHGYPGTARYQFEPGFRGGERSQAAYLARSLPLLRRAGAAQVFVTLRDSWQTEFTGKYTTEGVVHLAQNSPFAARRKPAFKEVAELNARWRQAVRWRALRKKHLRAKARFERAARKPGISRRAARRYGRLARHHARMARRYTKKRSR